MALESGGVEFQLDGDALAKALNSTDGPVAQAMKTLLARAESAAKRRCRVDTGRLRSSISTELLEEDGVLVGTIGSDVEYAAPREFGYTDRGGNTVPPDAFLRGGIAEAVQQTIGGNP